MITLSWPQRCGVCQSFAVSIASTLSRAAFDYVAPALMTTHSLPGSANDWRRTVLADQGKAACLNP